MGSIHPAVSEICVPQSLDPICTKFDKFLGHGQAHLGQMGKWPWRCTTTGLDNSTELRMEKIHQAVTEIWVPQVWQPPARPPARTVTTIPLQPGGLRGKNDCITAMGVKDGRDFTISEFKMGLILLAKNTPSELGFGKIKRRVLKYILVPITRNDSINLFLNSVYIPKSRSAGNAKKGSKLSIRR